jgi:hypothetical protein
MLQYRIQRQGLPIGVGTKPSSKLCFGKSPWSCLTPFQLWPPLLSSSHAISALLNSSHNSSQLFSCFFNPSPPHLTLFTFHLLPPLLNSSHLLPPCFSSDIRWQFVRHLFWQSIWHLLVTFFLAFDLALAFCLTYMSSLILRLYLVLAFFLAFHLAFSLTFCLTSVLTFFLTFVLHFIQGCSQNPRYTGVNWLNQFTPLVAFIDRLEQPCFLANMLTSFFILHSVGIHFLIWHSVRVRQGPESGLTIGSRSSELASWRWHAGCLRAGKRVRVVWCVWVLEVGWCLPVGYLSKI